MHRPRAGLTDVLDILPVMGPHRRLISIAYCDGAGTSPIDKRFLACLYRHCIIKDLDPSGPTYDTPSKAGDYWSFFVPEIFRDPSSTKHTSRNGGRLESLRQYWLHFTISS
jgi:hypothetical protein